MIERRISSFLNNEICESISSVPYAYFESIIVSINFIVLYGHAFGTDNTECLNSHIIYAETISNGDDNNTFSRNHHSTSIDYIILRRLNRCKLVYQSVQVLYNNRKRLFYIRASAN
jgi:hypothetical protein